MAAKKGKKKGKRANPGTTSNPKPRRRRRSNTTSNPKPRRRRRSNAKPRRRRRRNPSNVRQTLQNMLPDLKEIAGYIGVNMAMNFAVLRFGGAPGALMGGSASPTMGAAWTGRQYAIGLGTAYLMSRFAPQLKMDARTLFRDGVKSLASRLFWTEGLSRSQWMRDTFGAALGVKDDGYGNRWLTLPDGSQVSLAGLQAATPMGALVGTDVYDGLVGADAYGEDLDELAAEGAEELDEVEAEDAAADDPGVLREARSIDAGGYLLPGGGRRYQRSQDSYNTVYRRFAPY